MNPRLSLTLVVARKELKNVFRNSGLLFSGLWFGGMFGLMSVYLGGQDFTLSNKLFSSVLIVGVLVGYSFSSFVFLREKRERIIESLLCTPLSLKSIWLGKVLGATIPAYLFSLLSVIFVTLTSIHSEFLPSTVILIHVFFVAPVFIAAAVSLMGLCQFLLGMRENRIIGFLLILMFLPLMYPSFLDELIWGNADTGITWIEVETCLIASALILTFTLLLSKYFRKEQIVLTTPSD